MADADSEDESVDDESDMEEEAAEKKKEYRELLKQKKKNAPKVPAKKSAKRAASDEDQGADDPPKKKPGRKSFNLDVWEKFEFVDRTSMSAPQYAHYVEIHELYPLKPVKFKTPYGAVFKRLDWGQSEPVKYFWKKLEDTDIEDFY